MRTARVIDNRTPMHALCFISDDRFGFEVLVLVAKMTWAVSPAGEAHIAVPRRLVRTSSAPHEGLTSIRLPHDQPPEKPGTDVLLLGTVAAEETDATRRRPSETEVRLRVGNDQRVHIDKRALVSGPRVWQKTLTGLEPGPAAPLVATPLSWENTYGGVDRTRPDEPLREERNPIGNGVTRDPARLVGTPAPPIEHPEHRLASRTPAPIGFGAIGSSWPPRHQFMGTPDEAWRRTRAPIEPIDFDPRADCVAPADQRCDPPLRGDENVLVTGVTVRPWGFRLPHYAPRFEARLAGEEPRTLPTHLDTFIIDADEGVVELTWRATVRMPPKSEQVRSVRVYGEPALPRELLAAFAERARAWRAGA